MTNRRAGTRNLATLGLAISAPIALFSGIGVGVTLVAGPPVFLVLVMVVAIGMTAVCLLVLAAENAMGAGDSDE